ncbi:MAG: methylmalonyl-CoA mutase [Hyphomonadaceae bacterium]|nr:methylmalonyl-CoA mutase [Hyphomonadaceae bacterium]
MSKRQAEQNVSDPALSLGENGDESAWRALVERGLKGAGWERLVSKTADGIPIQPLYRETDVGTASDEAGFAGAAPFVRGARTGPWLIRQCYEHPSPEQTNADILADLQGGVSAIELKIDRLGEAGVAIESERDLDIALADVILEAAPVSLDAGARGLWAAELLEAKLKGVATPGAAFNVDPIGALMRTGVFDAEDITSAARFAAGVSTTLPAATALRVDARPVHEAGGTEAQEIATALAAGIAYLRALVETGLAADDAAQSLQFALSVGPDVLVEAAKLRALRLCWARTLEASGVEADKRAAHIHAFTSRRMMTRYDAETNILRVTTAAFAAAIGGADAITTLPFTDALGLPTPFARRVARNTQLVLIEESHLDHVADPAGGAWFMEKLTRDLATLAWEKMQGIESQGGIIAVLQSGALRREVGEARAKRQAAFAKRKETITGVTDFPLLGQRAPDFLDRRLPAGSVSGRQDAGSALVPIRWAEPFEALRERAEGKTPGVFYANLGALADFSPRSVFAQSFLAVGGVASLQAEAVYASIDAMIAAFKAIKSPVAIITGTDAAYAEHAANAARALKKAGANWVALAGRPGKREAAWREAGIDQFVFVSVDVLKELETLHAALGV